MVPYLLFIAINSPTCRDEIVPPLAACVIRSRHLPDDVEGRELVNLIRVGMKRRTVDSVFRGKFLGSMGGFATETLFFEGGVQIQMDPIRVKHASSSLDPPKPQ